MNTQTIDAPNGALASLGQGREVVRLLRNEDS